MSSVGIGLMGFGRIGRNLFRILYQSEDIRLRAISDIADHKALEYLLRFDTILGPFPDDRLIVARGRGEDVNRETRWDARRKQLPSSVCSSC